MWDLARARQGRRHKIRREEQEDERASDAQDRQTMTRRRAHETPEEVSIRCTLEDTARTARRVYGGAHPATVEIEKALQDARAALARDG